VEGAGVGARPYRGQALAHAVFGQETVGCDGCEQFALDISCREFAAGHKLMERE
jgi:hypothetical protein